MKSFAKFKILGRVGQKPEYTSTDKYRRCRFSVAENYFSKAEGKEVTLWHDVVAWDGCADICRDWVEKGSQIYLEGRIVPRKYEKDGVTMYVRELIIEEPFLFGKKPAAADPGKK